MGKKGPSKKTPNATSGPQISVTIREASNGKKQTNVKSFLKLNHLKNLATWASGDGAVPSLGAFFGHHLAAYSQTLGSPVDPSLFTCQRCESVLHPGYNCTIRIEKKKINPRHKGEKALVHPRNNIVFTCHFCSHRNLKRGTPRDGSSPKPKPMNSTEPKTGCTVATTIPDPLGSTTDEPRGKMGISETSETSSPVTLSVGPTLSLLEAKMKKRNRYGAKKMVASESASEGVNAEKTNRRRRKSWTSLKEIAESNDNGKRFMNLPVPFSL